MFLDVLSRLQHCQCHSLLFRRLQWQWRLTQKGRRILQIIGVGAALDFLKGLCQGSAAAVCIQACRLRDTGRCTAYREEEVSVGVCQMC
jgi:hypothetical protein